MSGLLRRLAGQALRGPAAMGVTEKGSRIRPVVGIHTQVPLASHASVMSPLADESRDTRSPSPETLPRHEVGEIAISTPVPAVTGVEALRAPERAAEFGGFEPVAPHAAGGRIETRVPAPLLGEIAAAPAARGAALPLTAPRIQVEPAEQRAAAEPTEVHVHIGRIEVIAPPEPARLEKKARVPRRDTRPLSEYLSRRRPA